MSARTALPSVLLVHRCLSTVPPWCCRLQFLCSYSCIQGYNKTWPHASGRQHSGTARMLKETASSITYSLTKLFNLSLTSGNLPTAKSNKLSAPSNYRPISILSIISKILERCIYRILDHSCNKCWNLIGQSRWYKSHIPLVKFSYTTCKKYSLEHEAKLGCILGYK